MIPFTRALGFGPLPALLERRAGSKALQRSFEAEGLPLTLLDSPRTLLPLSAMTGVFERAARQAGERTFGLDVGEAMTHRGFGLWVDYALAGDTLAEGLERLGRSVVAHQSFCGLELTEAGGARVWRYRSPALGIDRRQHSDHILLPMLHFVRHYLGSGWKPRWVELNYARDPEADRLEARLALPLRFGRPGIGLALSAGELRAANPRRPRGAVRILTLRDVFADSVLGDAPEPARSLAAIVTLRLLEGRTDIEGAAALAGLGVQGLQRRLRHTGLTYREVVRRARRARAESLLLETRMTVTEVALSLGYSDHANFTRAFHDWSGTSPSAFRRHRRDGAPTG